MPRTFALNENNDIYLDRNGNIAVAEGIEAVQFLCKNAVQTMLGELIYQTNIGMPNFQTIWNGTPNIPQFEASLIATLLSVEDVLEVKELSVQIVSGVLQYTATILTNFGQGAIRGTVTNV